MAGLCLHRSLLMVAGVMVWVPGVSTQGSGHSEPSPYWGDAEGQGDVGPSPPWPVNPAVFQPPQIICSEEENRVCGDEQFRSLSGLCNNLQRPRLGTPGHLLSRFLPAQYDVSARVSMRVVAEDGRRRLPNPSWVSRQADLSLPAPPIPLSIFFMSLGQFVDHDLAVTTPIRGRRCSPCDSWMDQGCAPIPLSLSDPMNTSRGRCLPFTRSVAEVVVEGGQLKTLDQPNLTTSFLDLSLIYDINECNSRALRLNQGGLLKSSELNLLPLAPFCQTCFLSGDARLNENIGLVAMHIAFHREHNRLAIALQRLNPQWGDERLFQEARRINIAQYQHAIISPYLVRLLGPQLAATHSLPSLQTGFTEYQPDLSPETLNEFTAAAFRFGHSQVPDAFFLMTPQYRAFRKILVRDVLLNSSLLLQEGAYGAVMRGLLMLPLEPVDLQITPELTQHLFEQRNVPNSGSNLHAINIARGRDHGLAGYTSYVQRCAGLQVDSFDDLAHLVSPHNLNILQGIYNHVRDIDLFVGGLAEMAVQDGAVGPTFACIIAQNFKRVKFGDRFWFEHRGSGLTQQQVASIRASSLAAIICHSQEEPGLLVPRDALSPLDPVRNPLVPCEELALVDLSPWREGATQGGGCLHKHKGKEEFFPPGATVPTHKCRSCICQQDQVVCEQNVAWCQQYDFSFSLCDLLCSFIEA